MNLNLNTSIFWSVYKFWSILILVFCFLNSSEIKVYKLILHTSLKHTQMEISPNCNLSDNYGSLNDPSSLFSQANVVAVRHAYSRAN